MPLSAGLRLGPYEILSPLGAGGMGEVYRARDTRLGRDVALKILPAEVANDPSRRQRFEFEARAVAALNHPNIVAVYDVGEGYMVIELVEGESLRGADLGLRKVMDVAAQIASGLAAAHDAGVTHRDLKPDNILLTRDGRVKILDFGLAKMTGSRAVAVATETVTALTDPGVVMGTVGYMSPEQVRGLALDHRSDIFSFGLILYELLAGKRAFIADTSVEVMTAILKQDAPELPETVPVGVRQIVAHCLEKEPVNRFQSARDLGFALTQPMTKTASGAAVALATRRGWPKWTAAVVIAAMLGLAAGMFFRPGPPPGEWSGVRLGGPEIAQGPRLSADGHLLAFQTVERGQIQVAIMKPETGNWSILTHNRSQGMILSDLAWSPDGSMIYYDRLTDVPNGIYAVPVLGGDERLILENAARPQPLSDGTLLVARLNAQQKFQLFRFWPDSGRLQAFPVSIDGPMSPHQSIRMFPDGKRAVAFGKPLEGRDTGINLLVIDLATGAVKPLLGETAQNVYGGLAMSRDGKAVFAAKLVGSSFMRVVSIPTDGQLPEKTLFTVTNYVVQMDAAPDGSIYASLLDRPVDLVRRSLQGGSNDRLAGIPEGVFPSMIATLPDGRVVATTGTGGRWRVMAIEKGKDPAPLITTAEETSAPFSVIGSREIAVMIGPSPRQTIAIADIASGRITRRISPGKGEILSVASSADAKTLYFAAGGTIWSVPVAGGEPRGIHAGDGVASDQSGKSLLVSLTESSKFRLFRVPLTGGPDQEIRTDYPIAMFGGTSISPSALNADGRLLLPLQPRDSLFSPPGLLDTATGRLTRLSSDSSSDYFSMAWLPDGQIVALQMGLRSTLWRFQPDQR